MRSELVQLRFRCPECGTSGLTPEMPEDKAIAVIQRELSLRCPRCSAIIEVTVPLGRLLWQTKLKEVEDSVREALAAQLEQRSPRAKHKKQPKGQDAPADGSQPIRSETNQTSSAADSRR